MKLKFEAEVWVYPGATPWHFVTLPKSYSKDLKILGGAKPGFGSVRVRVESDSYSWLTSVFPDNKSGCYMLPLSKIARKNLKISAGDSVRLVLNIL